MDGASRGGDIAVDLGAACLAAFAAAVQNALVVAIRPARSPAFRPATRAHRLAANAAPVLARGLVHDVELDGVSRRLDHRIRGVTFHSELMSVRAQESSEREMVVEWIRRSATKG